MVPAWYRTAHPSFCAFRNSFACSCVSSNCFPPTSWMVLDWPTRSIGSYFLSTSPLESWDVETRAESHVISRCTLQKGCMRMSFPIFFHPLRWRKYEKLLFQSQFFNDPGPPRLWLPELSKLLTYQLQNRSAIGIPHDSAKHDKQIINISASWLEHFLQLVR